MPSAYTADVTEEMSFEKFAMRCARAMGALIDMREEPLDAPIPERFEPRDYHAKKLQEAKAELARLLSLTPEQAREECRKWHEELEADKAQRLKENEAKIAAYEAMLRKVQAWKPPTEEHVEFKAFMERQLIDSIKFDDSRRYLQPRKAPDPDLWLKGRICKAENSVEHHEDEYAEEVHRTRERNVWLAALRASLGITAEPEGTDS